MQDDLRLFHKLRRAKSMRIEWIHIRNFRFIRDLEIRDIENALIPKYYSFENYFLDPKVMAKIGVVQSEEEFYETLFEKWQDYLHRLRSGRHLTEVIGHSLSSVEDVKAHMEEIRIYVRGHNLYDIFYGRFHRDEEEILRAYIQAAPRDTFRDILDAIDRFVYFQNRLKNAEKQKKRC